MQSNPVLLMCMIAGTITKLVSVLFSTYLILWIQTFATGTNGSPKLLQSAEQGKTIYSNIVVIATLISAFVLPVAGQICDIYPPQITIPLAFLLRAATTVLFSTLESPAGLGSLATCIAMIITTILENISVDTIFNKNLPKETRGVLNGVYSFAGQVGILFYSKLAGWLFDELGPKTPFYLIGLLDLFMCLAVIVTTPCGLFDFYEAKQLRSQTKQEAKNAATRNSMYDYRTEDMFGAEQHHLLPSGVNPVNPNQRRRHLGQVSEFAAKN